MFDLLGAIGVAPGSARVMLPELALPGQRWGGPETTFRSVAGRRLHVVCLERSSDVPTYWHAGNQHLFVIGEVFASRRWTGVAIRPSGPMPAQAIFLEARRDPTGFLHRLKGNFTLALLNEADIGTCVLFNSRFGLSPFYYAVDNERFIFSTSLAAVTACLSQTPAIDHAAIAELALFNYPLGDRTYFRHVKMLRPAEIVRIDTSGLQRDRWWDVRTLDGMPQLPRRQALEQGAALFHDNVHDLISDVPRIRLSFTSGFDSRAILSVLKDSTVEILGYAFGVPDSLNVTIPVKICERLRVPFYPIVLDDEYERVFDDYAFRGIVLSDCLATVERANYPYAFEKLAGHSKVVLTGLFGSELMRTFQSVGDVISANLARLNLSSDPLSELRQIAAAPGPGVGDFFAPGLIRATLDDIEADVSEVLVDRFSDLPADRRFYMFLLTEGLRKYFGAEIHMERPWGVTRFPFLDDDFVEFIFQAPFAGVHSRTLRPTVDNRFRSQYFYACIIKQYWPELLEADTDHGYPPADVLSPLPLLKIGPKFLLWKWRQKRGNYREFKTEEWTDALYSRVLLQRPARPDVLSPSLGDQYRSGTWRPHWQEFAKAASLKLWLESLSDSVVGESAD